MTTATATRPTAAEGAPSASGPVRQLLTQLTVALNRRRAYAATHPMVAQSEQALVEVLSAVVSGGSTLTIGVARSELLVDGVVVEGTGAVARELAERLHKRGVGALEFSRGLDLAGLREVLAWLAYESLPGDSDDRMTAAAPAVPGIQVGRVAYDRLILGDEADSARHELSLIWRSLAAAAFEEAWRDNGDDELRDPGRVASGGGGGGGGGAASGDNRRTHNGNGNAVAAANTPAGSNATTLTHGPPIPGHGDRPAAQTAPDTARMPSVGAAGGETSPVADAEAPGDDADSAPDDALLASPDASPEDIAQAIERRVHHPPYARRVARVLLSVTQQVTKAPPEMRAELAERLCTVLRRISEGSLASIVRAVGAGREQRQFLTSVVNALPVSAVIEWLEVTARATDQELSHHLLRILAKLSSHADTPKSTVQAHDSLRAAASDLVAGWELADPNPIEHADLLDHIALAETREATAAGTTAATAVTTLTGEHHTQAGTQGPADPAAHGVPAETARLVQMALEINVAGADAIDAAQAVLASGHAAVLFTWLDRAPGTAAAETMRHAVMAPAALTAALVREPFDPLAARALLSAAGPEAMPALLDVLEQANNRTARRMVFDRLCEFGGQITPLLGPLLEASPPWYFARNLLALLREVTPASTENDAPRLSAFMQYLNHASEQVRSEALRLLLEDRWTRDAALRRALDDDNPRVVGLAVSAAAALAAERPATASGTSQHRGPLSREVATRLVHILETERVEEEYRVRAVRALAGSPGPFVRDWLLAHVSRKSRFLRRLVLAEARPTVLAALQVLAHDYSHDSRVEPVLFLASGQRDARRDAVTATLTHAGVPEARQS